MNSDTIMGPVRPVSTCSIVACDPATGEPGVAVQSHYFAVGNAVPWPGTRGGRYARCRWPMPGGVLPLLAKSGRLPNDCAIIEKILAVEK